MSIKTELLKLEEKLDKCRSKGILLKAKPQDLINVFNGIEGSPEEDLHIRVGIKAFSMAIDIDKAKKEKDRNDENIEYSGLLLELEQKNENTE